MSTTDGLPLKTNKATLFHKIESRDCHITDDFIKQPGTVYVIDGNSLLHSLVQIPSTFGELAQAVFASLPKAPSIHFVTDTYKEGSIKTSERLRRGSSEEYNYTLKGPATRITNWKLFLTSDTKKNCTH